LIKRYKVRAPMKEEIPNSPRTAESPSAEQAGEEIEEKRERDRPSHQNPLNTSGKD